MRKGVKRDLQFVRFIFGLRLIRNSPKRVLFPAEGAGGYQHTGYSPGGQTCEVAGYCEEATAVDHYVGEGAHEVVRRGQHGDLLHDTGHPREGEEGTAEYHHEQVDCVGGGRGGVGFHHAGHHQAHEREDEYAGGYYEGCADDVAAHLYVVVEDADANQYARGYADYQHGGRGLAQQERRAAEGCDPQALQDAKLALC